MQRNAKHIFLLTCLMSCITIPAFAGGKNDPCSKPPELVWTPKASKQDQQKARELRAQGSVAIAISEDGDVTDAKVSQASSKEAAAYLLSQAKAMKYKPRPGCGPFKTIVNFTLAGL